MLTSLHYYLSLSLCAARLKARVSELTVLLQATRLLAEADHELAYDEVAAMRSFMETHGLLDAYSEARFAQRRGSTSVAP